MAPTGYGARVEGIHAVTAAAEAGRVEKLHLERRRSGHPSVSALLDAVGAERVVLVDDVLYTLRALKWKEIAAPAPCRYAGSTLQLDFGEQGQDKQVVLIDARPGRPARVEPVPLAAGRRLRDVEGTLAALEAMRDEFGGDYLRVTVEGEIPSGVAERVREILPHAVHVQVRRIEQPEPESRPDTQSPDLLFASFYRNQRGEEPPEAARNVLQTYASHLRKALGPGRLEGTAGGYVLRVDPEEVDALRFESLVERAGGAGDPVTARRRYGEALALWRGRPLCDISSAVVELEADRLEEHKLSVQEECTALQLQLGRHRELIGVRTLHVYPRHPVADDHVSHVRTDSTDRAGSFLTERERRRYRIAAFALIRVDEIHALVNGGVQCGDGVFFADVPPTAANRPRAKADFGYFPAGASKFTIVHSVCFPLVWL